MTETSDLDQQNAYFDGLQYSDWDRGVFERWREAGLACVHVTTAIWENAHDALEEIGKWNRLFRAHSDVIFHVRTPNDVAAAGSDGRVGVVLGFQNASPFEDSLDFVQIFHALGVRIAQLTYNNQNLLGSSCYEASDSGLSRFGKLVVGEMNRVGMLVDLSHVGDRSTLDAIAVSSRPVSITHANPTWFQAHPRNKSNEITAALVENGGIIGAAPYPHLTPPDTTLEQWSAMVARLVEELGVEHVAIGSDVSEHLSDAYLDWIRMGRWTHKRDRGAGTATHPHWAPQPTWFQSPAHFPLLVEGLSSVGLSEADVAAVAGGNWRRFFGEAFAPGEDLADADDLLARFVSVRRDDSRSS
jgi:microsomal dipeptidase-like Zn-dependent dipeptidase